MIKLEKYKWEWVKLGVVCEKVKSIDSRKQTGTFNYIDIGSVDSNSRRVSEIQILDWKDASSRARQIVQKGDTLFSTVRVNLERIAFLDKEASNTIASTGFTIIRANKRAYSEFLFYSTSSPNFINRVTNLQKGTAYPAVSDKIVFNEEIILPSLLEQKQIAALFQSIETAIEAVDKELGRLKALQKNLVNGLMSTPSVFGHLLSSKNCTPCKLGDLVDCDKAPPIDKNIKYFIGLENIGSDNFQLQGCGNIEDGTTFTKRFTKGDVLFGKRRAYLKKVAIADFDGICSNDILVLRTKRNATLSELFQKSVNELLPDLLPYYISSEVFIQRAISTSAGSLSPRTKWKDLADLEISLPDMPIQEQIVSVLNDLQVTLNHLKVQQDKLKQLKQGLLREILG